MASHKGLCPECQLAVNVKVNGILFLHHPPGIYLKSRSPHCRGSGKYPTRMWRIKDAKDQRAGGSPVP